MRRPSAAALVFALPVVAALGLELADRLWPPPLALARPPYATEVLDREGRPLRLFLAADERWRFPASLAELPPELPAAVVAAEDRRFLRHRGVDPLALARATLQNLAARRVVSGASTLPMQLARLTEPAPRTLGAKAREAFRALQLERRFTKRELLELYLTLAPYGGNLEGVAAASRFYFGKPAAALAPAEIALLVALPRAPRGLDPTRRPEAARRARDRVLERLAASGVLAPRRAAEARRLPVPASRRPAPLTAPHFARYAAARVPDVARLATTLDGGLQATAQALVERHAPQLRREGIDQAAAVAIEIEGRRLRAAVGSVDFFDAARQGQVDGTRARRSPGSTLKPFLYALGLDRGAIAPASYLLDVPTDFAGYVAENYDDRYRGRVTVGEALAQSLNAPAVRLLARLGVGELQALLVRGGLSTLDRPAADYGLPLVLGAGEVTLVELANLYAALADGGRFRPLVWRAGERPARPEPLISPEAAWVVTEILTGVRRPDLPESWELTRSAPGVAWKTGTSYGHRDAWAVGFSRRWAIAVWVGNFDGRPRHGISGSEHAAPLLFDLFRALEPGGLGPLAPAGLGLAALEVCALSHELPGRSCPERVTASYLVGRTRLAPCSYHRRLRRPSRRGFVEVLDYPAELVAWWREEGMEVPSGDRLAGGRGPRIVSPDAATPYELRRGAPLGFQRIPLVARVDAGAERLFWYRDGLLVAAGSPAERLFMDPVPGEHRLVVTDDRGRSDALTYRVGAAAALAPGP